MIIDDLAQAWNLMENLSGQIPIKAYPTRTFWEVMKSKGEEVVSNLVLEIEDIFYCEEQGGIFGQLRPWANSKNAHLVSITYLKFPQDNPFYQEIRIYQRQRILKLCVLEGTSMARRYKSKKNKIKQKGFAQTLKIRDK